MVLSPLNRFGSLEAFSHLLWSSIGVSAIVLATLVPANAEVAPSRPCPSLSAYWPTDQGSIVTPANLEWTRGGLPEEARLVLLRAYELTTEDAHASDSFLFAWVDLVSGTEPELIAEFRPFAGSGGRSFVFLERNNDHWRVIASFVGGFLAVRTDRKFEQLTIWTRSGSDYARHVATYSEPERAYVDGRSVPLPAELTSLPTGWVDLWRFFWFLNGGEAGCFGRVVE